MGGFMSDKILDIVNLDKSKYSIKLLLALGYPKEERAIKRVHREENEIVHHIEV